MEQKVICPGCGTPSSLGQQFCGNCGAKIFGVTQQAQQEIICPNCGFQNLAGQKFCGSCGAKLVSSMPETAVRAAVPITAAPAIAAMPARQETVARAAVPVTPVMLTTPVAAEQKQEKQKPVVNRERVVAKPTWSLAWSMLWRQAMLLLMISLVVYLIVFGVMLAMGGRVPAWSWPF